MTDQTLGPFASNGLLINPYGTRVSEKQQEARRRREAQRIDAAVAEREQAMATAEADRERERREDGQKRLEAYRSACLERWTDNGGTEAGFGSAWPALRDRWLADQLTNQERATVEDVARLRANPLYQV